MGFFLKYVAVKVEKTNRLAGYRCLSLRLNVCLTIIEFISMANGVVMLASLARYPLISLALETGPGLGSR